MESSIVGSLHLTTSLSESFWDPYRLFCRSEVCSFFFCWVVFYRADSLSLLICSQLSETECFHTGMVGAFPGVETPSLDNSFLLRVVSWVSLHILLTVRAGREYERMVFLVWVQYSAGVLRFQLKISNFQWKIIVCVFLFKNFPITFYLFIFGCTGALLLLTGFL